MHFIKSYNILPLILLCTIVISISTCSDRRNISGGNDNLQSVILPLNKGNLWSFEVIKYDSFGIHKDKYDAFNVITSDTTISKERWYKLQIYDDTSDYTWGLVRNRSDGLWRKILDEANDEYKQEELYLKYPAEEGDSFFIEDSTILVQVISTDQAIGTPSGIYQCYWYRFLNAGASQYIIKELLLAPDVGWVESNYFFDPDMVGIWFVDKRWSLKFNLKID